MIETPSNNVIAVDQPKDYPPELFPAVKSGKTEILQQVVDKEGDQVLRKFDEKGHTPGHWACFNNSNELLQLIVKHNGFYDTMSLGEGAQKPIHWAAMKGHIAVIETLLKSGVDVDTRDSTNKTSLIVASQYGQTHVAAFLISRKANLHLVDKDGDTALHWAAYNGHSETMRLLIHLGSNTELPDAFLMRPLHIASLRGHKEAVRDLCVLDNADMTARDINNETPKMLARRKKMFNVVAELDRQDMLRRGTYCPTSVFTLLDGSFLGHAKESRLLIGLCLLILIYGYPVYIYFFLIPHFNELLITHLLFFFLNAIFWYSLFKTYTTNPGFISKNQKEYNQIMNDLTSYNDVVETTKKLEMLCHTCRAVKPLRSKHCRFCDRCVKEFDHHCHYVSNCVGIDNRQWFFVFTNCACILSFLCLSLSYFFYSSGEESIFVNLGSGLVVAFLVLTTLVNAMMWVNIKRGMTTNEILNVRRYKHFFNDKGEFFNKFDKGFVKNFTTFLNIEKDAWKEKKYTQLIV